jgi:phosphoserine phosphatase
LQHLLLNLTVYCVRASAGSSVHVHARCEAAHAAVGSHTHLLVLEVTACGHVLSAAQLESAFAPYSPLTEEARRLTALLKRTC